MLPLSGEALPGLPAELSIYILSFLSPPQLAAARLASRAMYQAASDRSLYRELVWSVDAGAERRIRCLEASPACAHVRSVTTKWVEDHRAAISIVALLRLFPGVTSLSARESPSLMDISFGLPMTLRQLNIDHCCFSSLSPLGRLASLESLSVRFGSSEAMPLNDHVPFRDLPRLVRLRTSVAPSVCPAFVTELAASPCAPLIEALDLGSMQLVPGDRWWLPLRDLPRLWELGCGIDGAYMGGFVSALTGDRGKRGQPSGAGLNRLDVLCLRSTADALSAAVPNLAALTRLRSLLLMRTSTADSLRESVFASLPPTLVHLYLDATLGPGGIEALLRTCPRLRTLSCVALAAEAIAWLAGANGSGAGGVAKGLVVWCIAFDISSEGDAMQAEVKAAGVTVRYRLPRVCWTSRAGVEERQEG